MTSKSRRRFTLRGSRPAGAGRPRKALRLASQIVVEDDMDNLYFKLPGAKKAAKKHPHNLMDAVDNIRGASKKH